MMNLWTEKFASFYRVTHKNVPNFSLEKTYEYVINTRSHGSELGRKNMLNRVGFQVTVEAF